MTGPGVMAASLHNPFPGPIVRSMEVCLLCPEAGLLHKLDSRPTVTHRPEESLKQTLDT